MSIRKKAAAIGASTALAVGGAVLAAQPASAATYIDICVSSYSYTGVYPRTSSGYSVYVGPGGCVYNLYNADNGVRVDTISTGSYKKTEAGAGWNVTCVNGRNTASNPSGDRMYYRTWKYANC